MKILPNECSTHVLTKATSALGQNLSNRFSNIIGKMMRVQKKIASCPHYVIQHIDRDDEEKYCQNIAKNLRDSIMDATGVTDSKLDI